MFQTVGHQGVEYMGEAIGLPLYREPTFGKSKMQEKHYLPTEDDEVEDLYRLLKRVKVIIIALNLFKMLKKYSCTFLKLF